MKHNIAIIGGGPAGLMCAIVAKRNYPELNITIFEKKDIAHTLLPTGGGRCNLSHNENDIKNFVQNYPRGEKFLYSIFNQFFIDDTIDFFNSIGVKTYTQDDNRIFPKTNKSLDVIFALKNEIKKLGIKVEQKEILDIKIINEMFYLDGKTFDKVVISTGGRKSELTKKISELGHTIIPQYPALCGLEIKEKHYKEISGVSLKNISATASINNKCIDFCEDLLFTHRGISGPLSYKVSSLFSQSGYSENNPIIIKLNFIQNADFNLQKLLEKNSQKEILTLISEFMPKSLAKIILTYNNINPQKKCYEINKTERIILEKHLSELKLEVINPLKEGEIVSSGGVKLSEINSKDMQSKIVPNLYFCGEITDIDGFCGGFNLQNCWSTGYVAGINLG